MHSTYLRLWLHVSASNREVIKAARLKLKPACWHDIRLRDERKKFYRTMLEHHESAQRLYGKVMRGAI